MPFRSRRSHALRAKTRDERRVRLSRTKRHKRQDSNSRPGVVLLRRLQNARLCPSTCRLPLGLQQRPSEVHVRLYRAEGRPSFWRDDSVRVGWEEASQSERNGKQRGGEGSALTLGRQTSVGVVGSLRHSELRSRGENSICAKERERKRVSSSPRGGRRTRLTHKAPRLPSSSDRRS